MKYCLCYKKNDKNLLHIITDEDLKQPLFAEYVKIKKVSDEQAAFEAVADVVADFCEGFWKKAQKPDFSGFNRWMNEKKKF